MYIAKNINEVIKLMNKYEKYPNQLNVKEKQLVEDVLQRLKEKEEAEFIKPVGTTQAVLDDASELTFIADKDIDIKFEKEVK